MFLQAICLVIFQLIFMSSAQEVLMGLNDGKVAIKVGSTKMTWADADKYCASRNSRLFTPFLLGHSFLHNVLFENIIPTDFGLVWTGLKRQGTSADFEWIRAYEQVSIPTLTGSSDLSKNCGVVSNITAGIAYAARNCEELRPFICERLAAPCDNPKAVGFVEGNDKVFYSTNLKKQVSFLEAFEYCQIMGSHLPSLTNENENALIQILGFTTDRTVVGYWLGAHRININQWYWFDNAPTCYNNWNNDVVSYDVTNRMVMWSNQASVYDRNRVFGKWNYQDTNAKYGIICQKRCSWVPSSCY